jgi:plastocyanin
VVSIWGSIENRYRVEMALALSACMTMLALIAAPLRAEEHIVRTRRTEWVPSVLFIQPGDTVVWHGMKGHETELIEGMGPEGGTRWDSVLDAEGFAVTFHESGAYIYSCEIHMGTGMVGAIVVGDVEPSNLAAIDAALSRVENGRIFVERIIGRMKRELSRRN